MERRRVPLVAKIADKLARVLITLGGIGVIATVFGVFFYLLIVIIPLFLPGSVTSVSLVASPALFNPPTAKAPSQLTLDLEDLSPSSSQAEASDGPLSAAAFSLKEGPKELLPVRVVLEETVSLGLAEPINLMCDESVSILAVVGKGWARTVALPRGEVLGEHRLIPPDREVVGWHFDPLYQRWFASTAQGTICTGTWAFDSTFVDPDQLPPHLRAMPVGESAPFGGGVIRHITRRSYQLIQGRVNQESEVPLEGQTFVLIDGVTRSNFDFLVALTRDGSLYSSQVTKQKNLLTGKITARTSSGRLDVRDIVAERGLPLWLLLFGQGDAALMVWKDGAFLRVDLSDPRQPRLVEQGTLGSEELGPPTQACFLLGRNTLLLGHTSGRISGWFLVPDATRHESDSRRLVRGHEYGRAGPAVIGLATARRSRLFAAADASHKVHFFYGTSERLLAQAKISTGPNFLTLAFSPRDDYLIVATDKGAELLALRIPHPEVSWRSMWSRVWYEGYPRPAHVWQSTGGTDDFEPKYGMVPLVFGTVKATFYSLLFGLPLAFLAAIYTSEFVHPNVRSRIKPVIEMMASLPSVVLGFVAAFVVAPLVEKHVVSVLCFFATLPAALLFCGHIWEMVPHRIRTNGPLRLLGLMVAIIFASFLARKLGPIVEQTLFSGDIKRWLGGDFGAGWGGWVVLWLPAVACTLGWVNSRWISPIINEMLPVRSRQLAGLYRLCQLLVGIVLICTLTYYVALLSELLMGDPRGNLLGSYVQRNALVVGIIMGFAIIPIIFTLSEDALSAVPQELRAASLGAGATPWQTVVRVVVPAAMSGLFSAAMVGLGRAAGETMIVLMAAGNTPILEWNPFNGFRTLSANIAVELPEAVQGSTHYRMLFFAALCLFALTSVINTIAELVRIRFRQQTARL